MEGVLSYFWMIFQTILALAIVCGIAFLVFRILIPRIGSFRGDGKVVRVLERVPIDSGKSLCVIRAGSKYLLIGVTETGVSQIAELEEAEVKSLLQAETENEGTTTFQDKLAEAMGRSNRE